MNNKEIFKIRRPIRKRQRIRRRDPTSVEKIPSMGITLIMLCPVCRNRVRWNGTEWECPRCKWHGAKALRMY